MNKEHFIAIDWAKSSVAVARMTEKKDKPVVFEQPANVRDLKAYLATLEGKKTMVIEECNWAQWLYTELRPCVDELIICDPYANHLLKDGAKNDKIDAIKLCKLLKGGFLKPVFHSLDELIELRKIVSAYDDLVVSGARLKNQRNALFRARGKDCKSKEQVLIKECDLFVLQGQDSQIKLYDEQKVRYVKMFESLSKKHKMIGLLESIPGIGVIGATKLAAYVVDPKRFERKGAFLSYVGLVKHEKWSGGNFYGKRQPRYNRPLKSVFKTAAIQVLLRENVFTEYYQMLMQTKNYPEHQARHAVARRIAILALGVMKTQKRFSFREMEAKKEKVL